MYCACRGELALSWSFGECAPPLAAPCGATATLSVGALIVASTAHTYTDGPRPSPVSRMPTPRRAGSGRAAGRPACRQTAVPPTSCAPAVAMDADLLALPSFMFRPCQLEDLPRVIELEAAGYPPDEAASAAKLRYRQQHAGEYFLVAVPTHGACSEVVAFVCGTLSTSERLEHDSMSRHEEAGQTLCVHSVCVDHACRRQGVALALLRAYVKFVEALGHVRRIRLIAKPRLAPLYLRAGFRELGPSPVVHGVDAWHEFGIDYGSGQDQ